MSEKKYHPLPWHLEGPWPKEAWGADIAIVAADGSCVKHDRAGAVWKRTAEWIVETMNASVSQMADSTKEGK